MLRLKVLGSTLLAILVFAVVTAAAASGATPELPEFSVETGFTASMGKVTIEAAGGMKMVCTKGTMEATATSKKAGAFHAHLTGCESGGFKCNTSGDETGVVLTLGEWHLVALEQELLLFSLEEATIKCTALVTLHLKGSFLATIGPWESMTKEFEATAKQSKGSQEYGEYENDAGEAVAAGLLVSKNGGAFEAAGEEWTENSLTTTNQTQVVVIELTFTAIKQVQMVPRPGNVKVKVLKTTTTYRSGSAFNVKKNCVGLERPPCEYEFEFSEPLVASLTTFLTEYEIPTGSGRTAMAEYRLKV